MTADLTYHLATANDAELLAKYRCLFLCELAGGSPSNKKELEAALVTYFRQAIASGSYISYLAKLNNEIAGLGGLVFREQPGNFKNPSGKTAYILNMYTLPPFRRMGICNGILERLVENAKSRGVQYFELNATAEGRAIYKSFGFQSPHDPVLELNLRKEPIL